MNDSLLVLLDLCRGATGDSEAAESKSSFTCCGAVVATGVISTRVSAFEEEGLPDTWGGRMPPLWMRISLVIR